MFMLALIVLMFGTIGNAQPLSFSEAYRKALDYDARLGLAAAQYEANKEEIGKARASLRPKLNASALRGRNATDRTSLTATEELYYNSTRYDITLKQPLINLSAFASYGQSKEKVRKSEALYKKEEIGLIVRSAEVYFDLLFALDQHSFAEVRLDAVKEQLQQAKRRMKAGFGTITEINEAQAEHDMALADILETANMIEINRRELQNVTGYYPADPLRLDPVKMHLDLLDSQSVDDWVTLAFEKNPDIKALEYEVKVISKEIDKNRYSRLPTLDLFATKSYSDSDNNSSIGLTYDTYSLGLQMSLPLYTGGYTSATVRQAKANRVAAHEQLNMEEREISSNARKYYNGVNQSIARIHAYEQAVKSSEIALTGTKRGFSAGLRSNVDVLNAVKNVFLNKKNLAQAQYSYILSFLRLKEVAGVLSGSDVDEINSWLQKP